MILPTDDPVRTGPMTRNEFHVLAAKIKEDTKYDSGFQGIIDHPAHKEIVAEGGGVLKFILQDMQKDPWHWFMALYLITGEKVIKDEHRGRLTEMTNDWLTWGRENGIIPEESPYPQ